MLRPTQRAVGSSVYEPKGVYQTKEMRNVFHVAKRFLEYEGTLFVAEITGMETVTPYDNYSIGIKRGDCVFWEDFECDPDKTVITNSRTQKPPSWDPYRKERIYLLHRFQKELGIEVEGINDEEAQAAKASESWVKGIQCNKDVVDIWDRLVEHLKSHGHDVLLMKDGRFPIRTIKYSPNGHLSIFEEAETRPVDFTYLLEDEVSKPLHDGLEAYENRRDGS